MTRRESEEILEAIWRANEENNYTLERVKKYCDISLTLEMVSMLEKENLITYKDDTISLTHKGKEVTSQIIRRHRLAERLLTDVLKMKVEHAESNACEFEHSLAEEVTESICTLLGHPKECPHRLPIPEGKCCREAREIITNVVVSLDKLEIGERAKVAYISTRIHSRLHKLISFGISPGVEIRLHQKFPSYVIRCEQVDIALEKEVVKDIFVWRI